MRSRMACASGALAKKSAGNKPPGRAARSGRADHEVDAILARRGRTRRSLPDLEVCGENKFEAPCKTNPPRGTSLYESLIIHAHNEQSFEALSGYSKSKIFVLVRAPFMTITIRSDRLVEKLRVEKFSQTSAAEIFLPLLFLP